MSENYSNLIQSTIDELVTSHPDRSYFNSIMQKFDQNFMTMKKDQPSIQFPLQDKLSDLNPNNLQQYATSFHHQFTQCPQTQFKVDNEYHPYLTLQSQLTMPNNFPLSTQAQDQNYYISQYSIPSAMLDPQNYQKYQEEKQKNAQYEAYKAVFWESRAQKEAGSNQQQRSPYLKAQLEEQQMRDFGKKENSSIKLQKQLDRVNIRQRNDLSVKQIQEQEDLEEARRKRKEHESNLKKLMENHN